MTSMTISNNSVQVRSLRCCFEAMAGSNANFREPEAVLLAFCDRIRVHQCKSEKKDRIENVHCKARSDICLDTE